jgi:cysteine-rich repeat protein
MVTGNEVCDDGNDVNTDDCLDTCEAASCGDGFVWENNEECDDQNGDNADGCLETCVVPASCLEIITEVPNEASGEFLVSPANELFVVQCDMEIDGGGWTLAFNETAMVFDETADGVTDNACYLENCTNRAYSTVLLTSDILIDGSDGDMAGAQYDARTQVLGVEAMTLDHTMRELFTTPGPWYVEAEDNSNVTNSFQNMFDCNNLWGDYGNLICGDNVITFYDQAGCNGPVLEIGSSVDYVTPHNNCAGWKATTMDYGYHWPENFRIWVR